MEMENNNRQEKIINLISNFADQMPDSYLTTNRIPLSVENLQTQGDIFETLFSEYTKDNRGITLGNDLVSLEELKFFLSKETQEKGGYIVSCYIKNIALRNELEKLSGVKLQLAPTLVSMKPGDILFTVMVENLKVPLHEFKEDTLPPGSNLRIKKWWIKK